MQRFLLVFCCFVAYFCLFSNKTHLSLFSKFIIIIIIIVIILLLLALIVVVKEAICTFFAIAPWISIYYAYKGTIITILSNNQADRGWLMTTEFESESWQLASSVE